jgi:two-component system nitrate/nitrite response regulator NarL
MIRVVIADDHKIVLEGLVSLIEANKNITIVGKATQGDEVLDILENKEVDVVVLDIEMPELDGIEATKIICEQYPKVKILILTMYNTIGFIRKIAETGAHGYILKNKGKEELIAAIHKVHAGGQYFGEDVTKILIASFKNAKMAGEIKLTKREVEVLKLIADEYTTPMISSKLHIASTTVETHRRNLIEKIGVSSTNGLVRYAVENGYIS